LATRLTKAAYHHLSFGRHPAVATDATVMADRSWASQVKVGMNYKFTPRSGSGGQVLIMTEHQAFVAMGGSTAARFCLLKCGTVLQAISTRPVEVV
jgi:hypothetical protein